MESNLVKWMEGQPNRTNLELNQNDDDDSNTSDDSFVPDKECEKESNNKLKLDREPTNENQGDHFKTTHKRELGVHSDSTINSTNEEDNSMFSTGSILTLNASHPGLEDV